MKRELSNKVPFFPWNQDRYFEGLNEFANEYVGKIKAEKGIDLGYVEVKSLIESNKDIYWGNLITDAKEIERLNLSAKKKNRIFRREGEMQTILYPFGALVTHILNHLSPIVIDRIEDATIYVSTGLGSRLSLKFNTEKIKKEITSTFDSWSSNYEWFDKE